MTKIPILLGMAVLLAVSCGKESPRITADARVVSIEQSLSNMNVTCFSQDSLGFVWIGTSRGLNRYDGYEYTQFFHRDDVPGSLPSNTVNCLLTDRSGRLWVGTSAGLCYLTENGDFKTLDLPTDLQGVYQILQTGDGKILINLLEHLCEYDADNDRIRLSVRNFDPVHSYINDCFLDSSDRLWSVTNSEARCYDSSTLELLKTVPTGMRPHYAGSTSNGHIWMSEGKEILTLDMNSGEIVTIEEVVTGGPKSITMVFSLSEKEHLIAAGGEVIVFNSETRGRTVPGDLDFPIPEIPGRISVMYKDSGGNIWMGFENKGFIVIPKASSLFGSLPQIPRAFRDRPVSSLTPDSGGNLWLSTFDGRLYRYCPQSNELSEVDAGGLLQESLPNTSGNLILSTRKDRLWMIDGGNLFLAEPTGRRLRQISLQGDSDIRKSALADAGDGGAWVGALSGWLYRFGADGDCQESIRVLDERISLVSAILPLDDGAVMVGMALSNPIILSPDRKTRTVIPLWGNARSPDVVTAICQQPDGTILIGTRESGLYSYLRRYNKVNRIEAVDCEGVSGIVCDGTAAWISTPDGLYRLQGGQARRYSKGDGTGGDQYLERCAAWWDRMSMAVFGGIHGVTLGNVRQIPARSAAPIVFEYLYLQGQISSMTSGRPVHLSYDENSFNIIFSAPDFSRPTHTAFRYKLDGYNRDWVDVKEGHTAYFFNVPSGKHKLSVMSLDGAAADMEIHVGDAPWNTVWARLLYVLLFGGASYLVIHILRLRREREEEKRVNRVNMNFFTNISHEFRTPLTMIAAPLRQLSHDEGLGGEQKQLVNVAMWNSDRMLRLVNQLLDFGKLDSDALKLSVSRMDMAALMNQIAQASRVSIEAKDITLRLEGMEEPLPVTADSDKVEKMVSNLLGNALRFTPPGGNITLSLDLNEGNTTVSVANSGSHIPQDKLKDIFKRYYQAENRNQTGGTGIGLYFTARLAELHHGSVDVENLSPDGVCFTITLPAEDIYTPEEHGEPVSASPKEMPGIRDEYIPVSSHGRSVLAVDDDPDMLRYLKMLLGKEYKVLTASDAIAAIGLVRNERPELVVSDVAMPGHDGYWLCNSIKTDADICHIPVILLTARTMTESQVRGLESGADAYVTKPFEPDYLMALTRAILSNRDRLRGILAIPASQRTKEEKAQEEKLLPMDKRFLEEIYSLLEENLSNSDFNVNSMVDALHISRSKLYYKIVGLTGDTPNEFFRKYRLNRSLELLRKGEYNISEVAYMTGYSSPAIFSRNFKAMFGKTPTEYIRECQ